MPKTPLPQSEYPPMGKGSTRLLPYAFVGVCWDIPCACPEHHPFAAAGLVRPPPYRDAQMVGNRRIIAPLLGPNACGCSTRNGIPQCPTGWAGRKLPAHTLSFSRFITNNFLINHLQLFRGCSTAPRRLRGFCRGLHYREPQCHAIPGVLPRSIKKGSAPLDTPPILSI